MKEMAEDLGLPHVGDVGHDCIIEMWQTNNEGTETELIDFTILTLVSQFIIVKDPDGIEATGSPFTASFLNSGSDGKIHAVLPDIFNAPGPWTKQGQVTFTGPSGPFHTQEIEFEVAGARA
jgi:hypothetical protein